MAIGLNIAGGEFGGTAGVHNQDYHYPTLSELQFYKSKGVDFIRVPFRWERLQDSLGGSLDTTGDLALIKKVLTDAASLGMDVILDNHNYGRYKGVAIGAAGGPTATQFADFWKKMASQLKDYPALVGYDLMNEPHDMPYAGAWKQAAQAATDAIRSVDKVNTVIVEGTNWSGAHSWQKSNADLIINDPTGNIVYQAHQYLDANNSGTYAGSYDVEKAYPTVGVDRLKPFVEWLEANNLKGMIGEFGVPSTDPRWLEAQKNMLDYMKAHNLDGTAWGGGTWFGTSYSMYAAKPGHADSACENLLEKYYSPFDGFGTVPTSPTSPPPTTLSPSIAINNRTINEADGTATFSVTRSGSLTGASSVNYATAGGTASSISGDYTGVSGTLSFAAGEATKTISVKITNDTLVEANELFSIKLSDPFNAVLTDDTGVGTIISDDGSAAPPPPATSTGGLNGTAAADVLTGTSGNDFILGLDGNDVLKGLAGADKLDGGVGIDTANYQVSSAAADVDLMRTTQTGGHAQGDSLVGIENVTGSTYGDRLAGDAAANTLNGYHASDVINGRGGADTLYGGTGNDRFVFDSAADAKGDRVMDFTVGYDKLDLRSIDANSRVTGDQSFKWIDTGNFTGAGAELREYVDSAGRHFVAGDLNGDKIADFSVEVLGTTNLSSIDILL